MEKLLVADCYIKLVQMEAELHNCHYTYKFYSKWAGEHWKKGDLGKAISWYNDAVRAAKDAYCLSEKKEGYAAKKEYFNRASCCYQNIAILYGQCENKLLAAKNYIKAAQIEIELCNYSSAHAFYDKAAEFYTKFSDLDMAVYYYCFAIFSAEKASDLLAEQKYHTMIANIYQGLRKTDMAVNHYGSAAKIAILQGGSKSLADHYVAEARKPGSATYKYTFYMAAARMYDVCGAENKRNAINCRTQAAATAKNCLSEKYTKELHDKLTQLLSSNILNQSRFINQSSSPNHYDQHYFYAKSAKSYEKSGNLDMAIYQYYFAIFSAKTAGALSVERDCYTAVANIYRDLRKTDIAVNHYISAAKIAISIGSIEELSSYYVSEAEKNKGGATYKYIFYMLAASMWNACAVTKKWAAEHCWRQATSIAKQFLEDKYTEKLSEQLKEALSDVLNKNDGAPLKGYNNYSKCRA